MPALPTALRRLVPLAAGVFLVVAACGLPPDASPTDGNTRNGTGAGGHGGAQDGGGAWNDGGPRDGGVVADGGAWDAGPGPDGGWTDGGWPDGGFTDGGWADGGFTDGGWPDGGFTDGGPGPDGGSLACSTTADCPMGEICRAQCPACPTDGGPCPLVPCPLTCLPTYACGDQTCVQGEVCLISEGGVQFPDGGSATYRCATPPSQCGSQPTCDCLDQAFCGGNTPADCSGPIPVITCQYP